MGWLSNLLATLFGRKQVQPQRSPSNAKRKINKVPRRNTSEIPSTYRADTLGWLLKHRPQPEPGELAYDLNNRPPIVRDARNYLQSRINQIPPMPEIWHQVQTILQQDDASASDLGQCVAKDPVLTAQILKVCNSSAYAGSAGKDVSNIPLAIARLGLDEASSIIFRSLAPDLGGSEQCKTEIRHIWFHSQAVAMLSRILAEPSHYLSRHDATLAGMLHDIGKLVVLHIEPDEKLNHLRAAIDAGMMLALHWRLPRQVQGLILFHHHPSEMKANRLPESMRHAMLTLHVAHLILQHDGQGGEQLGEQAKVVSIWQSHQRTCMHDTLRFMQQEMQIPLDSESFYERVEVDLNRLKLSFSDLFG